MLELKKDIKGPGYYWRAGMQKSREDWQKEFPNLKGSGEWNEWFIDLDAPREVKRDPLRLMVETEFDLAELYSISYREAACFCLRKLEESKDAEIERLKGVIRTAIEHGKRSAEIDTVDALYSRLKHLYNL